MMMAHEVATLDECALHVYATVVSRAGEARGILDAGSKTLTSDTGGGLDGFGLIREYPKARIAGFSDYARFWIYLINQHHIDVLLMHIEGLEPDIHEKFVREPRVQNRIGRITRNEHQ